jgi:hypothetical protein
VVRKICGARNKALYDARSRSQIQILLSEKRMKRCFAAVTLSIAFMVTGCSKNSGEGGLLSKAESALTPSDPWTEFALMTAARSKATSWRSKMVGSQAGGQAFEMDSEVMCPDKQHVKMSQGGKVTMESYMIGSDMYVNSGGHVMKLKNPMAGPFECGVKTASSSSSTSKPSLGGSLPSVKDIASGVEEMQKMKDRVTITKGGVSSVEGADCQEWNIVYKDPEKNQSSTSEFCVGISDHLPRRMSMDSGASGKMEMTYWDWNSNIAINPPSS